VSPGGKSAELDPNPNLIIIIGFKKLANVIIPAQFWQVGSFSLV
jgi:hypothetical protein